MNRILRYFENEGERVARVSKILEKYPRKPNPPIGWDRPTPEDFKRLDEADMKQDSLPLQEQPIKGEETPVAATPRPTNENERSQEVRARELSLPFEPVATKFATAIADLLKRPLTRQTVEIAKEFDVEAIKYLDELKRSELRRQADSAFSLHRFLTGIYSKLQSPADSLRKTCSDVIVRFDRQERARIAEEQRKREAEIREQQERERAAELEALEADGKAEEAAVLKEEPLPPAVAPAPREATKIEGVSLVYSANVDPDEPITDTKAFGAWLAEHHEHLRGFDFKAAYWKSMLSAHLNKQNGAMSIEIPGLKIKVSGSSRHRSNGE
jgi:hypothetical protein